MQKYIGWVLIECTLCDESGKFNLEQTKDDHMLIISYNGFMTDTVHVEHNEEVFIHTLKSFAALKDIEVTAAQPSKLIGTNKIESERTITSTGLREAACCSLS